MEGAEKHGRTLMSPLASGIGILPLTGGRGGGRGEMTGGGEPSKVVGDSVTWMRESHCAVDRRAVAWAVEDHV